MERSTTSTLEAAFLELDQNEVDGVRGVWKVDSGKPGPVVGITVGTHGNEPVGIAAYHHFRHVYKLEEKLRRGTVIFVLNNPEAMRAYFAAVAVNDEKAKVKARQVNVNMNRLPESVFEEAAHGRYEIARAQELKSTWAQFDYALDIHSTLATTTPMIITTKNSQLEMISRFPIKTVIANIDVVQTGKPASFFYGNENTQAYGIEAGQHEARSSFSRAVTCTRMFLSFLGVIPRGKLARKKTQIVYEVFGSVLFPNSSYELTTILKPFAPVQEGQELATGDQGPILAKTTGVALMPMPFKKPPIPPPFCGEIMFFAHPPRTR